MNEYAAIYWAAACLVFWASGGVTKGKFAKAVETVCKDAGLSVPQEVLLTRLIKKMTKRTKNGTVR